MTQFSTFAKAAALLTVALSVAPAAYAADKIKPVTISAKTFASPESRLCMPAESAGLKVEKGQAKVLCLVQTDWESRGVIFKIK